jgi:zinc/manganese transport system substrate-binding protein
VLINGLGFEGWMERLVRSSATRARVVTVSQGVMPRWLDGAADPHAWQSLANARLYVENIRAALVRARPAQAPAIDARAAAYRLRIDALEAASQARFAAIPTEQRRVITTHDAFGYFGEAFKISFIAPQRWSTEAEPSAADVARVIRQIKAQKARALFIENMTDRRLMDRIAQETGVLVGGTLYADALSPPGTAGDSYLRMVAHNVEVIAGALEAAVPLAALAPIPPKK